MSRLNWARPRKVFIPWYERLDRDILPAVPEKLPPTEKLSSAKPKARREPPTRPQPAVKSPSVAADAFAGASLLRTRDLYAARDELCGATEAVVFCDGACVPNPGEMGLGAVVVIAGGRVELYASLGTGTNNLAELASADLGLAALPAGCRATVYADSQYLIYGMTKYAHSRFQKLKRGAFVPNESAWRTLDKHNSRLSVEWHWIRGHAGNRGNEIADELATIGRNQP